MSTEPWQQDSIKLVPIATIYLTVRGIWQQKPLSDNLHLYFMDKCINIGPIELNCEGTDIIEMDMQQARYKT